MPSHNQHLSTSQKLSQKQLMTPALLQSINLMAVPLFTLRDMIKQEIDKNPALEMVRDTGEVDSEKLTEMALKYKEDMEAERFEDGTDADWIAGRSDESFLSGTSTVPDNKQKYLEGGFYKQENLHEHLLDQLRLLSLETSVAELAEKIIWNLDDDGFNREDPNLLSGGNDRHTLLSALKAVRGLEPSGCGCMDWRESLLIQAEERGDGPEDFYRYVEEAFPLLETHDADYVRSKMHISVEDWEDWEEYVQTLNPFPGREYSTAASPYIVPELKVLKEDGEYKIELNDEVIPVLRVDPVFENIRDNVENDRDTVRFVADHARDARFFINSLRQRENTLLKTASAILDFQREFFAGGPRYLKPLILKDVATEIGVHETTVSRITTNKYIETEWGIFELKYFFSHSISGKGSTGVSKIAAMEVIKEIIFSSGSSMKLTDQKISDLLARRGIKLARRTVAKYRKELDQHSSYTR